MKLLVINGPNLNMLGIREPDVYGNQTYKDLVDYIKNLCMHEGIDVSIMQSNHEGAIVDAIQQAHGEYDGIVINPAAYTHTSIAILDALKSVNIKAVEVHLSNIFEREKFRHLSYAGKACVNCIYGEGFDGYGKAILYLRDNFKVK